MKRIEGVTERLLAAAREEFLEKGYEAASLRAIAERAGSSKGAIYVRYADKEALYAAVVDPVIEELCLFFTEEFDVVQRQLRGNLPQAFVHALLLETAHALGDAGVEVDGFGAAQR